MVLPEDISFCTSENIYTKGFETEQLSEVRRFLHELPNFNTIHLETSIILAWLVSQHLKPVAFVQDLPFSPDLRDLGLLMFQSNSNAALVHQEDEDNIAQVIDYYLHGHNEASIGKMLGMSGPGENCAAEVTWFDISVRRRLDFVHELEAKLFGQYFDTSSHTLEEIMEKGLQTYQTWKPALNDLGYTTLFSVGEEKTNKLRTEDPYYTTIPHRGISRKLRHKACKSLQKELPKTKDDIEKRNLLVAWLVSNRIIKVATLEMTRGFNPMLKFHLNLLFISDGFVSDERVHVHILPAGSSGSVKYEAHKLLRKKVIELNKKCSRLEATSTSEQEHGINLGIVETEHLPKKLEKMRKLLQEVGWLLSEPVPLNTSFISQARMILCKPEQRSKKFTDLKRASPDFGPGETPSNRLPAFIRKCL